MVRLIVAGAFMTLLLVPRVVADDKKADPPWARVTLHGEIDGTYVDFFSSPQAPPEDGKALFLRWLGPTPPGTTRFSADAIQLKREWVHVVTTRWTKGYWLSVCLEPNEDYMAAARNELKTKQGEPEEERFLRAWAMLEQARDLDKWVLEEMRQIAKGKQRDRPPQQLIFEGAIATPEKAPPQKADLAAWEKQFPEGARHAAFGVKWQHPAILAVGKLAFRDRLQKGTALPEPGRAWVEGQLVAGKYDIGRGKTSAWAIRNGTSPIAITGKGVEGAGDLKGDVRAVGRLQVGPDRQLLLEVEELALLKK